jgi:hypothetical protein
MAYDDHGYADDISTTTRIPGEPTNSNKETTPLQQIHITITRKL